MIQPILSLAIRYERDIVLARQRARQIAAALGVDGSEQTRISTAVSEIARNAFSYGGGGKIEFRLEGKTAPQVLTIRISDEGPGIPELPAILEGRYRSPHGMGMGILGARRLMDQFHIETGPTGTTVVLKKLLVRQTFPVDDGALSRILEGLVQEVPRDAMGEVQQQNQELLRTLEELTERQGELHALNRELEDTNRGVVALYAELDEKADHLRRADEIKTRFISNMSHEFRTPVNSIQALAGLLLSRSDGDLTGEQERQVTFIRKAADALAELVNDLLDLAKVEAGKTVVRPTDFAAATLFGTLRGMLRPLLVNESVNLVFDDPDDLPTLHTDEGKVSQILRNFISNALKFTERGEVRVRAELGRDRKTIVFRVIDTGIGIPVEDHERIFQEFTQLDSPLQRRVKGTGLGLPLCRKLAGLLGGTVSLDSAPGVGSTFTLEIPMVHAPTIGVPLADWVDDPARVPVLFLEDEAETLLVYEKFLSGAPFAILAARTLREAREILLAVTPRAVVLDIMLSGEDAWGFLAEIKRDRPSMPVLVLTSVEDQAKGLALGADAYAIKPIDRAGLLRALLRLTSPEAMRKVLIIDDDEIARYVLRQSLLHSPHVVLEAGTGIEGLAQAESPDLIFLDLSMPGMDGFEVLPRLREQPSTSRIPVVIVTSSRLDEAAFRRLGDTPTVLFKDEICAERVQSIVEDATTRKAS